MTERVLHKFVPNPTRPGKFILEQMTPEEIAAVPIDWPLRAVDGKFVPVTEHEIDEMATRAATHAAEAPIKEIDRQLAEIDRLTMVGVRGLREFILVQAQLTDHLILDGTTPVPGAPISPNTGIQKLLQLETRAVILRAQRKALTG